MLRTTAIYTNSILRKEGAFITFYTLLLMVIVNYINNLVAFKGLDVVEMYQPLKITLLSYNRVYYNASNTLLLVTLYPILVTCPAGLLFYREQQSGLSLYQVSRIGQAKHLMSWYMSAFLSTFIVFSLPFVIEMALNMATFPLSATGDLSNLSVYNADYMRDTEKYMFYGIYSKSIYAYYMMGILMWGLISGLLGTLPIAFCTFMKIRYGVLLFVPSYLLLNLPIKLFSKEMSAPFSVKWYDYLLTFNTEEKNTVFFIMAIIVIAFVIVISALLNERKDQLD